jgi:hypothetical protein
LNPRPPHQLRQATSRSTLNEVPSQPVPISRSTLPASSTSSDSRPVASPLAAGHTASQVTLQTNTSLPLPKAVDSDAPSIHSVPSQLVSPPLLVRQTPLRSKLSLPNLRRKQRLDEEVSINSPSNVYDSRTPGNRPKGRTPKYPDFRISVRPKFHKFCPFCIRPTLPFFAKFVRTTGSGLKFFFQMSLKSQKMCFSQKNFAPTSSCCPDWHTA